MLKYRCVFCPREYTWEEMEERCKEGNDWKVRAVPRCDCGKSSYIKLRESTTRRVQAL